jgi:hypothetical protein
MLKSIICDAMVQRGLALGESVSKLDLDSADHSALVEFRNAQEATECFEQLNQEIEMMGTNLVFERPPGYQALPPGAVGCGLAGGAAAAASASAFGMSAGAMVPGSTMSMMQMQQMQQMQHMQMMGGGGGGAMFGGLSGLSGLPPDHASLLSLALSLCCGGVCAVAPELVVRLNVFLHSYPPPSPSPPQLTCAG